jgi:predicted O-linked N-acetylglucosamine transferase (SPINDLY family)
MIQDQTSQSQAIQEWEQQVIKARAEGDYDRAALLCEQRIETEPGDRQAYWHLGLVRLLQEQEEEAQLTWMTVLAEAPPAEEATWVNELLAVLEEVAQEQVDRNNLKLAWTIRQYIREFAPTQIANLLHLIQLSVQQDQFYAEELVELGLIDLLNTTPNDVPGELLLETVSQFPDVMLGNPETLEFVEACIPYGKDNPSDWTLLFMNKAARLARFWRETRLASQYGEYGLELDSENTDLIRLLASYYYATNRFDEGIDLVEPIYQTSESLIEQLNACNTLISGYMKKGALWDKAEQLVQEQTELLLRWLQEMPTNLGYLLGSTMFCSALFVYAYFGDRPEETRSLQNQIAKWYHDSVYAYFREQNIDYQPCNRPGVPLASGRRLRIGYLSRSMDRHSVGWISRWLFHHHNHDKFEVYAYFNHMLKVDDFSRQWFVNNANRSCSFEGDVLGIAREIQNHEIDILVDLDSLTVDMNYSVMALKPAPVQVTWLGLDASGLPTVDYFIVDRYVVPEKAQDYYQEKLWYMPETYVAVDGFEVWIPTLRREDLNIPDDAVIYFSAQQSFKRHPDTVRLQLQILREVPNSYFLIKGIGDAKGIQTLFNQLADDVGVSCDRLRFLPGVQYEETHRANLSIADVVLDTFPYNGATTTLETLWVGVPLVTKVGQQFAARNSYTMMVNAGISEGIAWSDEEYVDWGVRLGKDADLRNEVRWKLRQSRRTAPLWNGEQFTRQMETAYEQMWAIYCNGGKDCEGGKA